MAAMAQLQRPSRGGYLSQRTHSCGSDWGSPVGLQLSRAGSAVDMRQLTASLLEAREGTGEVRSCLLSAAFKPRLPGLTKMISKLSKEGAWRKALEVFEAVEEMGLTPDTALTNSAISACDKGGRWQKALEIFEWMERQRLPRDAITYSATISALAKGKQWHAALQVFDHMQVHGVDADVVTCCSLINALERGGQWQLAEKLFLRMCTVQDGETSEEESPLFVSLPSLPLPSNLLRSQTSPSSVLDALQSPGRASLTSIAESPRHLGAAAAATSAASAFHDSPTYAASLGILGSVATAKQDVLAGLCASSPANGSATMADLATRFDAAVALSNGTSPHLERTNSTDSAATGNANPNPFAAASKLVSDLRKSSPDGSMASLVGANSGTASDYPAAAGRSDSLPTPPPGLPGLPRTGSASLPFPGSSPQRPSSSASGGRITRTHSLKRELGIPQLEAARSLQRAISCYPELDGSEGGAQGEGGSGLSSLFNFSHVARVTPNRVCCNALLAAYARAKPPQFQRALHLLAAMWDGGPTLAPDSVSYNTAIKACANAFQLGKALEVHREMEARGVKPSVTTFNCLITAASDSGSYAALLEVGQCLATAEQDVQACVLNTYVAGLVKVGHWDEALARFHDMLGPSSPTRPTASTFNTIMSMHMRQGQCEQVRSVFDQMLATGLHPSIVSYNTLLASFASLGAWREALDALNHVMAAQADGVNPNTSTFGTCLTAVAKGADTIPAHQHAAVASRVLQVFGQLRSTPGCSADAGVYSSLAVILDACQQPQQVVALHNVMLACGHTPDAATAHLVLRAALQAGDMRKAFALATSLQMQGERVGPNALAALMSACLGAGAWDLALQLCNAALCAQGSEAAPLLELLLEKAAESGRFDVVVEALTAMRGADLPVTPRVAGLVMASQSCAPSPTTPCTPGGGSSVFDATLSALQTAQSMSALPSAFERAASIASTATSVLGGSPGAGAFACLPRFASASSLSSSPSLPPPPPPPPSTPPNTSPSASEALPLPPAGVSLAQQVQQAQQQPHFTIRDANSLLAALKERLDATGGLEVMKNMKLAGIQPNQDTFSHLIELLVRAGEPHSAVAVCAEAHESGALCAYALPNLAGGSLQEGTALGNVVDLRGCGLEVGMAAVLTWLTRVAQLQPLGLVVRDKHVKIILGSGQPTRPSDGAPDGESGGADMAHRWRDELAFMLTTGTTSLPAFRGLVPVRLEADAVSCSDDGCALLVKTHCLYRAFAAGASASACTACATQRPQASDLPVPSVS